jgi:2-C-methyl-D-erythritol 4-phosphate cytidylyltransferase/2-C-methyl-D-erythritol 2,4-cyclodiphosphate synthase
MQNKVNTIAIILASGLGQRFDKSKLKQYQIINDKAVIYHSVNMFKKNLKIDKVIVVINKKHEKQASKHLTGINSINIIHGGLTRQESVHMALKYIEKFCPKNILIHDAVRPNIKTNIINLVLEKLHDYNAVVPVIKITDSVKTISENLIKKHIDRDKLVLAQTPQGFRYSDILAKHNKNKKKNLTDDSTLFTKVYTVPGDPYNLKITNKLDLESLRQIMFRKKEYIQLSGLGIDVHKFDKNMAEYIRLGGIDIKFNKSLKGHSDADVVLHALVDSILGCISGGDIGSIFSDKDPKWKNANSKIFIDHAINMLNKNKCILLHTDITIICEEPKISKYRDQMKNNIAKMLNISNKNVSIKATTTEKLGFIGRKEGIMTQCLTTISRPI